MNNDKCSSELSPNLIAGSVEIEWLFKHEDRDVLQAAWEVERRKNRRQAVEMSALKTQLTLLKMKQKQNDLTHKAMRQALAALFVVVMGCGVFVYARLG